MRTRRFVVAFLSLILLIGLASLVTAQSGGNGDCPASTMALPEVIGSAFEVGGIRIESADLSDLVSAGAFKLITEAVDLKCKRYELNLLLVQGSADSPFEIMVNGVPMRVSSTVAIRLLQGRRLQVSAFSGVVELHTGTDRVLNVPAGHASEVCSAGSNEDDCESSEMYTYDESDCRGVADLASDEDDFDLECAHVMHASGGGGPRDVLLLDLPSYSRVCELCYGVSPSHMEPDVCLKLVGDEARCQSELNP